MVTRFAGSDIRFPNPAVVRGRRLYVVDDTFLLCDWTCSHYIPPPRVCGYPSTLEQARRQKEENCHMDTLHPAATTPRRDMGCPGSRVAPGGTTDRP